MDPIRSRNDQRFLIKTEHRSLNKCGFDNSVVVLLELFIFSIAIFNE